MFLTHQYIKQIDDRIRSAIFGNAGTIISFRIGARDAEYLATEFYPVFNKEVLINQPRHSMYLKLMIDGATSQPFSATTLPAPIIKDSLREKIIEHSQNKFATQREAVEKNIFDKYGKPTEKPATQKLFN